MTDLRPIHRPKVTVERTRTTPPTTSVEVAPVPEPRAAIIHVPERVEGSVIPQEPEIKRLRRRWAAERSE